MPIYHLSTGKLVVDTLDTAIQELKLVADRCNIKDDLVIRDKNFDIVYREKQ